MTNKGLTAPSGGYNCCSAILFLLLCVIFEDSCNPQIWGMYKLELSAGDTPWRGNWMRQCAELPLKLCQIVSTYDKTGYSVDRTAAPRACSILITAGFFASIACKNLVDDRRIWQAPCVSNKLVPHNYVRAICYGGTAGRSRPAISLQN